jgi:hypothetical protein
LSRIGSLTGSNSVVEKILYGEDVEKYSIEYPDEPDRHKLSRFAYEDIQKFSSICAHRQDIWKISHYK